MKQIHKSKAIVLFLIFLASFAIWSINQQQTLSDRLLQFTTTSTRTTTVTTTCTGKNRTTLISTSAQTENDGYRASMRAQFTLDQIKLVKSLLTGAYNDALTQVQTQLTPIILFVLPFLVGLVLILVMWPYLCCCCLCPSCCPSKCCQKNENEQYTKCQLYWPSIVLIIALLLACVASIVGFTRANGLSDGVNNIACSAAILIDDFINGNVTTDGTSFFTGVATMSTQLTSLNASIGTINATLYNVSSNGSVTSTLKTNIGTAKTQVSKIPTGIANVSMTLSYVSPLDSSTVTGTTIPSTFPTLLGTPLNSSSLVGASYAALISMQSVLDGITSAADGFSNSMTTFTSSFSGVQTTISNFVKQLTDGDTTFNNYYTQGAPGLKGVPIGISVFFGVTIGLSVLGILGLLLMAFCDKYKCRYLIYFSCCILFLLGIIGFLITVLFSVILPVLFYSCQFFDYALQSKANFDNAFGTVLDATIQSYVTVCLPTQSGLIINIIAANLTGSLNGLSDSISKMNTFNSTQQTNNITTTFNQIGTTITSYQTAQIMDITTTSGGIDILNKIANPSNYACGTAGFTSDSFIPSISQNPVTIACTISGGANANSSTCTSSANFNSRAAGCVGCMDTYDLFVANSTTLQVATALNARYPAGGACVTFANDLSNVWNNFYNVKKTTIGAANNRYTTNALPAITTVTNTLTTTLPTLFTSVINQLKNISSTLTDPTYGFIAGFNCKLIGQDIKRVVNVSCLQLFNNFYFLRLVLGIGSFGILFSMCCAVCSGVRHYKHSQRKDTILPGFNPNSYDGTNTGFNQGYNVKG